MCTKAVPGGTAAGTRSPTNCSPPGCTVALWVLPPAVTRASVIAISRAFNQIKDAGLESVILMAMAPEKSAAAGTSVRSTAYFTGRISSLKRSFGGASAARQASDVTRIDGSRRCMFAIVTDGARGAELAGCSQDWLPHMAANGKLDRPRRPIDQSAAGRQPAHKIGALYPIREIGSLSQIFARFG